MKLKSSSKKSDSDPSRIGKILGNVLPIKHDSILKKQFAEYKPHKPVSAHQRTDEDRIVKLEQRLEYLSRQIENIAQTINVGLPSK